MKKILLVILTLATITSACPVHIDKVQLNTTSLVVERDNFKSCDSKTYNRGDIIVIENNKKVLEQVSNFGGFSIVEEILNTIEKKFSFEERVKRDPQYE